MATGRGRLGRGNGDREMNMGVMICLGQGGLRCLSASSLFVCLSVDNITQKVMNGLG